MVEKYNEDLKPGDIILFKGSENFNPTHYGQYVVKIGGVFSQQEHGHYDTVHAGICIGHDVNGLALMAHVTRSKNGFTIEPVNEMFARDGEKRNFLVFRADEPGLANSIVSTIKKYAAADIKTYSIPGSILAGFTKAKKNETETKLDKYTEDNFCSKFVLETLEIATGRERQTLEKNSPKIQAHSSPKDLESYLTKQHGQYERMFCNPNNTKGIVLDRNKAAEKFSSEMEAYSNSKKHS